MPFPRAHRSVGNLAHRRPGQRDATQIAGCEIPRRSWKAGGAPAIDTARPRGQPLRAGQARERCHGRKRTAGAAGRRAGDLRRGLSVRARAARLRPGRTLRARGRARCPRGGAPAAPRVRARRLRRGRGVHLLRPPREAQDHRQGADPRAAQSPGAADRQGGSGRERRPARGRSLQHQRLRSGRSPILALRAPGVRGAGRLGASTLASTSSSARPSAGSARRAWRSRSSRARASQP